MQVASGIKGVWRDERKDYDIVIEKDKKWQSVQCRTTSYKARNRKCEFIDGRYVISLRTIKTKRKVVLIYFL